VGRLRARSLWDSLILVQVIDATFLGEFKNVEILKQRTNANTDP
jgi:hypothetical protein